MSFNFLLKKNSFFYELLVLFTKIFIHHVIIAMQNSNNTIRKIEKVMSYT